jgi:hypothetical protein
VDGALLFNLRGAVGTLAGYTELLQRPSVTDEQRQQWLAILAEQSRLLQDYLQELHRQAAAFSDPPGESANRHAEDA